MTLLQVGNKPAGFDSLIGRGLLTGGAGLFIYLNGMIVQRTSSNAARSCLAFQTPLPATTKNATQLRIIPGRLENSAAFVFRSCIIHTILLTLSDHKLNNPPPQLTYPTRRIVLLIYRPKSVYPKLHSTGCPRTDWAPPRPLMGWLQDARRALSHIAAYSNPTWPWNRLGILWSQTKRIVNR